MPSKSYSKRLHCYLSHDSSSIIHRPATASSRLLTRPPPLVLQRPRDRHGTAHQRRLCAPCRPSHCHGGWCSAQQPTGVLVAVEHPLLPCCRPVTYQAQILSHNRRRPLGPVTRAARSACSQPKQVIWLQAYSLCPEGLPADSSRHLFPCQQLEVESTRSTCCEPGASKKELPAGCDGTSIHTSFIPPNSTITNTYTAFCHLQDVLPKHHAPKSCCLSKTFTPTAMLCKPLSTYPFKAIFDILHTTAKVKCTNVAFKVFICNKIKPQHISQSNVTLTGYIDYDFFSGRKLAYFTTSRRKPRCHSQCS
eukprot:XP_021130436.1 uncharacterized protein LOC106018135 [Anas platyrhynchos]